MGWRMLRAKCRIRRVQSISGTSLTFCEKCVVDNVKLIAVRLNDVRDGKDIVSGVLEKYKSAILKNGMVNGDSLYTSFFALKQQKAIPPRHGAHTAW